MGDTFDKKIKFTPNCQGTQKILWGVLQFEKCAATIQNWITGILNSFSVPLTNGFTEGCNNKIKVLKTNAYGYRNFNRFRDRILHMFSHQKHYISKQVTA